MVKHTIQRWGSRSDLLKDDPSSAIYDKKYPQNINVILIKNPTGINDQILKN